LGAMNRRRRRVWVDGEEYGTGREAARAAGVAPSTMYEILKKGGCVIRGHRISEKPPAKPAQAEAAISRRGLLLRYPPGEGPLYQGSRRWT
jgi:hypothetical protein